MNWTQSKIPGWTGVLVFAMLCTTLALHQRALIAMTWEVAINKMSRRHTVGQRVAQYGETVRERMEPFFEKAGIAWPARRIVLVGLKDERQLEVWGEDMAKNMRLVRIYPVLGASGKLGPKLHEGDGQVPEGIYAIESLNPNSAYHLSLRVGYPNAFDQERAKEDGREQLGGDIMIHGRTASAGCLAMGDEAAEDLFVMAALVGPSNVEVVLAPCDLRITQPQLPDDPPAWINQLYKRLETKLKNF